MSTERHYEAERLQLRAMEAFREARWDEAVPALSALQALDPTDPEIGRLLAEAQLKLEISRASMPSGTLPPQRRRFPLRLALIAVVLLVSFGAGGFIALGGGASRIASAPPTALPAVPLAAALVEPATAVPTATSAPTAVPQATLAPSPVVEAGAAPGSLLVRMAEGQTLTRTTRNIEIILDASGSMLGDVDGQLKIDIAHDALGTLINTLPDGTNVALRTYGHRRTADCTDLEQVQGFEPLDRARLVEQVAAIRPVPNSRTPMAASIQAVSESLGAVQGETLVVLVSDGDETCDGDPAAAARALHEQFPSARVSVIGFNIEEQTWRERLQAIAAGGSGGYYDASDAAQLEQALRQAVALTYRVVDAAGVEQYAGPIGSTADLPAGAYRLEISDETPLTLADVVVSPGGQTVVQLSTAGERMTAELLP